MKLSMYTSLEHSPYHKTLRVMALVVMVVMLFQGGLVSKSTTELASITGEYLTAAVGVSVGVPQNELNTLTTRIAELETQVGYKDAQLRERELEIGLSSRDNSSYSVTIILASIQFILLLLIVVNYTLDYFRAQKVRGGVATA